jgi:hypothetical protein
MSSRLLVPSQSPPPLPPWATADHSSGWIRTASLLSLSPPLPNCIKFSLYWVENLMQFGGWLYWFDWFARWMRQADVGRQRRRLGWLQQAWQRLQRQYRGDRYCRDLACA